MGDGIAGRARLAGLGVIVTVGEAGSGCARAARLAAAAVVTIR